MTTKPRISLRGFYFVLLAPLGVLNAKEALCPAGLQLKHRPPLVALQSLLAASPTLGAEITGAEGLPIEGLACSGLPTRWGEAWRLAVTLALCISGLVYLLLERRTQNASSMKTAAY